MKSLLILRHLKVENANAIAGLTYGFPAITQFLGFTHALSRALNKKFEADQGVDLGAGLKGCAVVCHQHHVNAHQPSGWGDYVFALTRNPLTKQSKSPAFVEEARMHMDISLLIECDFDDENLDFETGNDEEDIERFESVVNQQLFMQRLAGGTIQSVESVEFMQVPEETDDLRSFTRRQLLKLLPGFVLVDQSILLHEHYEKLKTENPNAEMIDAWLDFSALKYRANANVEDGEIATDESNANWEHVEKPGSGYLVPLMTGYKGISTLYDAGEVARTRDSSTPFRFVESVYGIGKWVSPHRFKNLDYLMWRYEQHGEWYLCRNDYQPEIAEPERPQSEKTN